MNKYKIIFYALTALFILSACEEVIELDLENAEVRTVIEATINADTKICTVHFTQTNGFYESNDFTHQTDATIVLTKEGGESYHLEEETDQYTVQNIDIQPDDIFIIVITDKDGQTYTAQTQTPHPTNLESIEYEELELGFGPDSTGIFEVYAIWNDPVDSKDFYRIKTYLNDTLNRGVYYFITDEFSNGEEFFLPVSAFLEEGDKVQVDLISIDENTYDYFSQIENIQSQGFNSANPFNPQGNFDNDALGYFGIYYETTQSITID